MAILTIIVGLVFVLLLLSLLATTVMELISSFFSLRGRNLTDALRNMLARTDKDEQVLKAFQNNSLYKQLSQQYKRTSAGQRPPSYMNPDTFQSILFDIILKGEDVSKLKDKINELPDEDLRNVLNQLLNDANNELTEFKLQIEKWYNSVMDRASGWYKRFTQQILIGVGLVIAIIFNADTLSIYAQLESDPAKLASIAQLAEDFAQNGEGVVYKANPANFKENAAEINSLLNNHIDAIRSPLGLGWDAEDLDFSKYSLYDWLAKLVGYIVTALAISMGAPFWFDLLRKLVNIRSSGAKS